MLTISELVNKLCTVVNCTDRFGYLEELLNDPKSNASHEFSAGDITTDIIRLLYTNRPEASEADCLLNGCFDLASDSTRPETGNGGLEIQDEEPTEWTIATSGEVADEQRCKHINCVDYAEFKRFYAAVEPFLGKYPI